MKPEVNSTSVVANHEIVISIVPRGCDAWMGTRAQLIAEGLASEKDFDSVAPGCREQTWTRGGFEYWLLRHAPKGSSPALARGFAGDYWLLRRTLASRGRDGFAAARIHEKERALAAEIRCGTREGIEERRRCERAARDVAFQSFKRMCLPQVSRRRRTVAAG